MNIQTATIYAKQGYHIYREAWVDHEVDGIVQTVYLEADGKGQLSFMHDAAHYAILTPEDCLADDWTIFAPT